MKFKWKYLFRGMKVINTLFDWHDRFVKEDGKVSVEDAAWLVKHLGLIFGWKLTITKN